MTLGHILPTGPRATQPVLQRALGTMLGAAVGDALGAPFEFGPAGRYSSTFPEPVVGGTGEMIGGGAFGWEPGEFTDDTQMALVLAEALLRDGGLDLGGLFAGFVGWAHTAADVGTTTSAALAQSDVAAAQAYALSGPIGRASNGALMRVFPIAVAYLAGSEQATIDAALAQSGITHPPASAWGAAIGAVLMRRAILGSDPFADLDGLLALLPAEQVDRFAEVLDPAWSPGPGTPGNGSVWGCLGQAVWAVRGAGSFAEAVIRAIDLGGDTDTVACVAGAIAGARFGVQAIPARWKTYVHGSVELHADPVTYDEEALQDLTRRLLGRGARAESPLEPAKTPTEVAPGLYAADLLGAATVPTDWAIVSLCRTYRRFSDHPVRRAFYLRDEEGDANIGLADVIADAVDTVDALLAEGRTVVVHCHGGHSRTAFVLKAWAMRTHGLTEREAHAWIAARWTHTEDWTASFRKALRAQPAG
jgi:ADP-ribosyl-[dinitrogen reductase] hydrolase